MAFAALSGVGLFLFLPLLLIQPDQGESGSRHGDLRVQRGGRRDPDRSFLRIPAGDLAHARHPAGLRISRRRSTRSSSPSRRVRTSRSRMRAENRASTPDAGPPSFSSCWPLSVAVFAFVPSSAPLAVRFASRIVAHPGDRRARGYETIRFSFEARRQSRSSSPDRAGSVAPAHHDARTGRRPARDRHHRAPGSARLRPRRRFPGRRPSRSSRARGRVPPPTFLERKTDDRKTGRNRKKYYVDPAPAGKTRRWPRTTRPSATPTRRSPNSSRSSRSTARSGRRRPTSAARAKCWPRLRRVTSFRAMAEAESAELQMRVASLEEDLRLLSGPRDPADTRNVIPGDPGRDGRRGGVPLRGDLLRMYSALRGRPRLEVRDDRPRGDGTQGREVGHRDRRGEGPTPA